VNISANFLRNSGNIFSNLSKASIDKLNSTRKKFQSFFFTNFLKASKRLLDENVDFFLKVKFSAKSEG